MLELTLILVVAAVLAMLFLGGSARKKRSQAVDAAAEAVRRKIEGGE